MIAVFQYVVSCKTFHTADIYILIIIPAFTVHLAEMSTDTGCNGRNGIGSQQDRCGSIYITGSQFGQIFRNIYMVLPLWMKSGCYKGTMPAFADKQQQINMSRRGLEMLQSLIDNGKIDILYLRRRGNH